MITFEDEDLDEIPVDSSLLLTVGTEECDPLMIDSSGSVPVQDPLECTPITTMQPLEVKIITVGGTRRSPRRNVLSASKNLPSANNILGKATTTCTTSSLTKVPEQTTATKPPLIRSLNDFKAMTFSEFTQEMQQNIQDIVKEAIGLFDLNPREYHPFYLRIFKYVTIGQKLGFVAADEAYVSSVWTGFFKYADAQYEASRKRSVSFTGDKSPYATYILTRKLVVNGKEISEKRDEVQVRKNFEQVEAKAKMIRDEWDARASPQKIIANDYKARLKFFKECMTFTHPADCVRLNKLWTKFLSEDGFSECTSREEKPVDRVDKVKTESPIPVVTIPSEDEEDKDEERASKEEENKKLPKKLIIKVIVAPPSSPSPVPTTTDSSKRNLPSSVAVPRCESPSPPCSPAYSAAPSPPPSPEPVSPPPQASTPDKSESTTEKSDTKKNQTVHVKTSKIINRTRVQGKTWPNGKNIRTRKLNKSLRRPTNVLKKKKRKIFSVLTACSKMRNSNEEQQVSRQVQMEKVINQRKSKLLSGIAKKKKVKATLSEKPCVKLGEDPLSNKISTLSTSAKNNKTKTRKPVKRLVRQASTKTGTLANQKLSATKLHNRLVEKRKRRKNLLKKKKVNCDILQERLEKRRVNLNGAEANSEDQDKGSMRDRELMDRRTVQNYSSKYMKYAKMKAICPIANCGKELTILDIVYHLKAKHGIKEFGKLWQCPFCTREIRRRWGWLAHIEGEALQKGYQVDMDKMVEVAKKQHAEIDWTELKNMVSKRKLGAQFIVNPSISQDPFEHCEECGVNLVVGYLVIHKESHNPDRYWAKCQVCARKFYEHRHVWYHYCESHLDDTHPLKSLDPAISDKVLRFMAEEDEEQQLPKPKPQTKPKPTSQEPPYCEKCNRSFSTQGALTYHLNKTHGGAAGLELNLQCSYCQKVFTQRDTLKAHVDRLHLGKVKSKCQKCSNELQTPGKLWRHLIDKHGESAFEAAAYCEVTFIPCTYCGLELLEGRQYQNHMLKQHPDTFEKLPAQFDLKCPHCSETFRMRKSLNAHIQLVHEKISKCERCNGKDFKTPGKLWRHLIDVHQVSASEAAAQCKVEFSPCAYCGQEMLEGKENENHVKSEHPEHFEEFITAERLAKLERIKSGGTLARKPRVRTDEDREARRIKDRETRERQREQGIQKRKPNAKGRKYRGGKSWSSLPESDWCPECGQRITKSKFILARHMRLVHGIDMDANPQNKPSCPFEGCSAYFARKNLKKHVRYVHTTHIEQRIIDKRIVKLVEETRFCVIHLCTLCEVYLFHFDEVKVHMFDSHPEIFADLVEGASPVELACPHCPSKFPVDDDVRCHVELVHPEMCWRCPECSKVMISPDDFDTHFVKEHSEPPHELEEQQPVKNAQEEGFIVRVIRTKNLTADKNRAIQRVREKDHDREKRRQRNKLRNIEVSCEICKAEVYLGALVQHLDKVHGLVEDGDPITCTKCEDSAQFIITNQDGRCSFVSHMETVHQSSEAEMEEIIKMMGKIHTKVDWQTLEIQNPQGLAVRRHKFKNTDDEDDQDYQESRRKPRPRRMRANRSHAEALADREITLKRKRETFSMYFKYGQLRTKCPIASCGDEFVLNTLSGHLKTRHNIDEKGKTWTCPHCGKDSILRRDSWLGHIDRMHSKRANMEELIAKARKVHPNVEVTEPTNENNEPVGTVKRRGKRTKVTSSRRRDKQPVEVDVPVRASRRNRAPPGKYAKYFDDKDDQDDSDDDDEKLSEYEKSTSDSDFDVNADDDAEIKKSRRKVGRPKSSSVTKGKRQCSAEEQNIELEKRLVIRLVRLTEDELDRHLRRRINDDGEQMIPFISK